MPDLLVGGLTILTIVDCNKAISRKIKKEWMVQKNIGAN